MKIIKKIKENQRSKYILKSKYGLLKISVSDYNRGIRPTIASAINKNLYFANKSREVHGNRYTYDNVIYKGIDIKVSITCSIHGDFLQTPHNHLKGNNCTMCGRLQSSLHRITYTKGKNKAIVYCLECSNSLGENFYKIGFTKHSIKYRYTSFSKSKMPYNYKVLWEKVLDTKQAIILEGRYHKALGKYHYIPKVKFAGSKTECFKIF